MIVALLGVLAVILIIFASVSVIIAIVIVVVFVSPAVVVQLGRGGVTAFTGG